MRLILRIAFPGVCGAAAAGTSELASAAHASLLGACLAPLAALVALSLAFLHGFLEARGGK